MTPTAIIALIKDLVIVIAIGVLAYVFFAHGKDVVKIADVKAIEKQIIQNSQTEATWRQEQTDANAKRNTDLSKVTFAIDSQHAPVYIGSVQPAPRSAGACPVPGAAAKAGGEPAGAGGADAGPGGDRGPVDQRPAINAFELKAETAIVDCRAALDQWPAPKTP